MALTKSFKALVQRRVADDAPFAEALLREGIDTMLTGDVETPIDQPSPAPRVKRLPPSKVDQLRGLKESRAQIEVLKAKWPSIFNDPKNVRPLAGSVLPQVATALGWSNGYTRGVFKVWKSRNAYCRAVLCYSVRINLDGSPSDETVNDRDRELAKATLDQNAVRNAAKRARELAEVKAKEAAQCN
ncbi:MAG: ProQ/FINO family protein [Roseiarcus sp.]